MVKLVEKIIFRPFGKKSKKRSSRHLKFVVILRFISSIVLNGNPVLKMLLK
jgi:hypothetical protein